MIYLLRKIGQALFRIWFYILALVPILILMPVLAILAASESLYPKFYWVARNLWATPILYGLGCWPKIVAAEKFEKDQAYMLVANHTSILDVMLMLKCSPRPFVFVGKKELVKIPVFGYFYKRVCIMVDRDSTKSRSGVYMRAQKRLQSGISICIFPEGGVPEEHIVLDKFKSGAFKMAVDHKIPIVPMTFFDSKKRFSFTFFSGGPGVLRVNIHSFLWPDFNGKTHKELRDAVREQLLKSLEEGFTKPAKQRLVVE